MKNISKYINIIALFTVSILIIAILSSYFNFGFLSVFLSVFLPLIFIINIPFALYGLYIKKYVYLIGFFLFLFFFSFFFQTSTRETHQSIDDSISVLSYNVRGFNSRDEKDDKKISSKILNFIDSKKSDIIVLQESSYKESRGIKNYPYRFLGYREYKKKELLAIYSKYPILNTGYIDFSNTLNNGIYADIKVNKDTIRVYNIHLQSFRVNLNSITENNIKYPGFFGKINNSLSKQIQQAKLVKNQARQCNKKVIICGDFNSPQFSLPYRILKKGLNDSFVIKGNGLGTTYSLFHYPLRLDFFLLDQRLEVINHENFDLNLSDHEPILMKFKIKH